MLPRLYKYRLLSSKLLRTQETPNTTQMALIEIILCKRPFALVSYLLLHNNFFYCWVVCNIAAHT